MELLKKKLSKVRKTEQNVTNITTATKEKVTTRSWLSESRLGARKQGQSKNNKYKDQKVLEREEENKNLCRKCKIHVQ